LSRFGLGSGASVTDAANNGCTSRKFVAGEKFWITGIVAQKDGILVSTFSDQVPVREGLRASRGRFCEDICGGHHGSARGRQRQPG
jgi:hypothetical protein